MTEKPASSTPPNPKPTEPWRVERMVQPVPAHLGEDARFSPWLVVAAVAAFVVIGTVLLFLSQAPATPPVSSGSSIVNTEATPTRRITVIRITATAAGTDTATA